jgi:serine-type D-Ala-D-Ala carboxypeptidase (penicillin-binding protein 5/6)
VVVAKQRMLGIGQGARGRHAQGAHERLQALGEHAQKRPTGPLLPPARPSLRQHRAYGCAGRFLLVAVIVVVVVLAGVQWFRPLPSPSFRLAKVTTLRLPGTSPSLPWPTTGSAAVAQLGVGSLGHSGNSQPVPIASIAKVLTAYQILRDHPLSPGSTGPVIPVTPATVTEYQSGVTSQQSEVQVSAGETLTELQALEGLLVASGNDMATLLAQWDSGTTAAFVAKANASARSLGLSATHMTDPSGLDSATVSTAADLIRLGQAAMAVPTFSQIVGMAQVTLPVAGLIYNFDYDLGHDGIVGIKTGSDSAAGGCFLFEAQKTVDGTAVVLVGAVLGQEGSSPITTALSDADQLVTTAFSSVRSLPLVPPGMQVGSIVAPWGASTGLVVARSTNVVSWPGVTVVAQVHAGRLGRSVPAATQVATLRVDLPSGPVDVPISTAHALPGPSIFWRLTRT